VVGLAEELPVVARPVAAARFGALRETWRRLKRNRGAMIGLAIAILYVAVALLADLLAPYDPADGNVLARLRARAAPISWGPTSWGATS
jgi:ABC-type antimicrobial peptide transport system permease subunit